MARVWQRVCEKTTTSNPDYEGGVFEVTLLTLDFAASVTTTFWGGRESYCVHHNLHASSRTWNCKWAMPSTFHPGQSFFSVFVCNHFYFVSQTDKRTEHCPSKRLSIYLCICLRFFFCFVSENVNSTRFWRSVMLMTFWQMKCNCLCRHHP